MKKLAAGVFVLLASLIPAVTVLDTLRYFFSFATLVDWSPLKVVILSLNVFIVLPLALITWDHINGN